MKAIKYLALFCVLYSLLVFCSNEKTKVGETCGTIVNNAIRVMKSITTYIVSCIDFFLTFRRTFRASILENIEKESRKREGELFIYGDKIKNTTWYQFSVLAEKIDLLVISIF